MGVLVLSSALMLFVSGTAPFGLSASWSTESFGSSLVFTRSDATATIGQKVAGYTEQQGKVSMFTVEEIVRREGMVYYRVSDFQNSDLATLPASRLGQAVVLDIPFMGVFARMLTNLLGVMTLIGLPLCMLLINYVLYLLQRVIPVISSLERSAQVRSRATRKIIHEEKEKVHEDTTSEGAYVTVLKPYNLRGTYSH
jgi:hypothetical protein